MKGRLKGKKGGGRWFIEVAADGWASTFFQDCRASGGNSTKVTILSTKRKEGKPQPITKPRKPRLFCSRPCFQGRAGNSRTALVCAANSPKASGERNGFRGSSTFEESRWGGELSGIGFSQAPKKKGPRRGRSNRIPGEKISLNGIAHLLKKCPRGGNADHSTGRTWQDETGIADAGSSNADVVLPSKCTTVDKINSVRGGRINGSGPLSRSGKRVPMGESV